MVLLYFKTSKFCLTLYFSCPVLPLLAIGPQSPSLGMGSVARMVTGAGGVKSGAAAKSTTPKKSGGGDDDASKWVSSMDELK